jgi:hypothetical protein
MFGNAAYDPNQSLAVELPSVLGVGIVVCMFSMRKPIAVYNLKSRRDIIDLIAES